MPDYTILVVDYDPRTADDLREHARQNGLRLEIAKNGPEAIEKFDQLRPHLTLIEFMLPKTTGLEVCRELRSKESGDQRAIVIMSSRFRSRQYRTQAIHRYHASDFIEKPVDGEKLSELLRRHTKPGMTVEVQADFGRKAEEPSDAAETVETPQSAIEAAINDGVDAAFGQD